MSFYEHFFWNYAIVYRKPWAWKMGVGGVLPDVIYMVPFLPKIFSYQSFREWMHDPLWDTVWNSLFARSVHSFTITHVSDGYPIFYPLSGYRFPAFVSYWEREFHAIKKTKWIDAVSTCYKIVLEDVMFKRFLSIMTTAA